MDNEDLQKYVNLFYQPTFNPFSYEAVPLIALHAASTVATDAYFIDSSKSETAWEN